jgi:release factor glutamine methyltransferase
VSAPPRPLELSRLAARHLTEKGVEDGRLDAELLLAHVLGVKRLDLYLQFERPLEPAEVGAYREAVRRRAHREPLQYITGEAAFRELTLGVDPRVLIPRPETEVLVGEVLRWTAGQGLSDPVALDLGTGSGAIALALLDEGPFRRVVATDPSADALDVAFANAARTGLSDGIELRAGGLYDPIGDGERYDVIVTNPPYVADRERDALMPEVRDHEPGAALFAGADGLALIRPIVHGAPAHLVGGGLLAIEIGLGQAEAVTALMREAGFAAPRVVRDLAGHDRVVIATYDGAQRAEGAE